MHFPGALALRGGCRIVRRGACGEIADVQEAVLTASEPASRKSVSANAPADRRLDLCDSLRQMR
jgi:hypothetical protein